jgi:hypothetical protein
MSTSILKTGAIVVLALGAALFQPAADILRLKDVVFGRRLSDAEVCSPGLPDLLVDGWAAAMPVFRFLATLR